MFDALLVVMRESAELLLICAAVFTWLAHAGRSRLWPAPVAGVGLGLLAAWALFAAVQTPAFPVWLDALLTLGFALLVLTLSTHALGSFGAIARSLPGFFAAAPRWAGPVAFAIAALAALREMLEVLVFLRGVAHHHGSAAMGTGALLGLLATALLVLLWRVTPLRRAPLRWLFRLSSLLLSWLAIQLLLDALAQLAQWWALAQGDPRPQAWLVPFVDGGDWHGPLCVALMLIPLWRVGRDWWFDSELRSRSDLR